MDTTTKQVCYFQGGAVSIGGYLQEPFRFVPSPNSVALSSGGGVATLSSQEFNFEDQIKLASARSYVIGRPVQDSGPWTERVVSVIEGLDLFGVVTADRIAAQVFVEVQPARGGPRKISFAGSSFTNLRIDGKPVTLRTDETLLPSSDKPVDPYNQDAVCAANIAWPSLSEVAANEAKTLLANKNTPDWARTRFGWIADEQPDGKTAVEGYTQCSLVNQVDGLDAGQSFAHCIDVPGFGTLYLAEVLVYPYAANLTMLRAELNCKHNGVVCFCCINGNGSGYPPT